MIMKRKRWLAILMAGVMMAATPAYSVMAESGTETETAEEESSKGLFGNLVDKAKGYADAAADTASKKKGEIVDKARDIYSSTIEGAAGRAFDALTHVVFNEDGDVDLNNIYLLLAQLDDGQGHLDLLELGHMIFNLVSGMDFGEENPEMTQETVSAETEVVVPAGPETVETEPAMLPETEAALETEIVEPEASQTEAAESEKKEEEKETEEAAPAETETTGTEAAKTEVPETEAAETEAEETEYEVQKGDCLWKIAGEKYGSGSQYPRIAEANGIRPPYEIYPGQKLIIPA